MAQLLCRRRRRRGPVRALMDRRIISITSRQLPVSNWTFNVGNGGGGGLCTWPNPAGCRRADRTQRGSRPVENWAAVARGRGNCPEVRMGCRACWRLDEFYRWLIAWGVYSATNHRPNSQISPTSPSVAGVVRRLHRTSRLKVHLRRYSLRNATQRIRCEWNFIVVVHPNNTRLNNTCCLTSSVHCVGHILHRIIWKINNAVGLDLKFENRYTCNRWQPLVMLRK